MILGYNNKIIIINIVKYIYIDDKLYIYSLFTYFIKNNYFLI